MHPNLSALGGAAKLGFFVSGLMIASLTARFATADTAPGVERKAEIKALAARLDGRLSDMSLRRLFDAEGAAVFARFDPEARRPGDFAAIHLFEGPAPTLRPVDLAPQSAQTINAALPISTDPNPPARPFVLSGSAEDKAKALTCLTQAVYYEAGFEPAEGQAAVAQVVLNRMRHPIFPHSVCGVVYQGAELKTGCQFSFTCDGSLGRRPQQAAWDRAEIVAKRALNGFVMKSVGGATHYHTEWVVPWWRPTVTKVAQVGAHIFYRWQGALGLPAAFASRYAGGERLGLTPGAAPVDAPAQLAAKDADGRVHMVLSLADNAPRTPRERLLALSAQGALGAGFKPSTQVLPAPSAPVAAATAPSPTPASKPAAAAAAPTAGPVASVFTHGDGE